MREKGSRKDKEIAQVSEISFGRGNREGSRLLILVLGLVLASVAFIWAAAPGIASAEDEPEPPTLKCTGVIEPDENSIFDDAYLFDFGCNQDIYSVSLVSNREIDSFATEAIGIQPNGDPGANEDFFCVGAVPAFGFGCYGSPGKTPATKISAGNQLEGKFTLSQSLCDANVQPSFMAVPMVGYQSVNDLVDPPKVTSWMATTEPFVLNTKAIRCKVLNPKAKAKAICAKVKKAKTRKAKATAKRKCSKARAAIPKPTF